MDTFSCGQTIVCSLLLLMSSTIPVSYCSERISYCQRDSFNATCDQDEVIIMKTAKYGRMRMGKCVTKDHGYLGCSRDALATTDALCSGRRSCHFRVFDHDEDLKRDSPCPAEIDSYLEASYTCEKVAFSTRTECDTHMHLNAPPSRGYLASAQAQDFDIGTSRCPWRLKAEPQQAFSLSLLYFDTMITSCDQQLALAVIKDGKERHTITACDVSYVTKSHDVTITIGTTGAEKFLIEYEVTGCADPQIPKSATLTRQEQNAVIQCKSSQQTWNLVCTEGTWVGELGNCTTTKPAKEAWDMGNMINIDGFPYGILILVAIGVALGVFSGGLLLSLAATYMKRRRAPRTRPNSYASDPEARFYPTEPVFMETTDDNALDSDRNRPTTGQQLKSKCLDDCHIPSGQSHKDSCPYGDVNAIQQSGNGRRTRSHVYEMPRFV